MAGKVPAKLAVGLGCLEVRDFASGIVLAGERGRSGERYLLSGENITTDRLVEEVASITGVRGPRLTAPAFLVVSSTEAASECEAAHTNGAGQRGPRERVCKWFGDEVPDLKLVAGARNRQYRPRCTSSRHESVRHVVSHAFHVG
jgi:nucleoside-diphosphate-sugar epimerase